MSPLRGFGIWGVAFYKDFAPDGAVERDGGWLRAVSAWASYRSPSLPVCPPYPRIALKFSKQRFAVSIWENRLPSCSIK
jgi:hypothetical protein